MAIVLHFLELVAFPDGPVVYARGQIVMQVPVIKDKCEEMSGARVNFWIGGSGQTLLLIMNKPILLIDDDRSVRQALRLLLENHAFDCKEADDGLEGLALLDGGLNVDVILSDYHMPVIDGLNFLKALSYRVSGQGVSVILLSGNMTKKMERVAKEAGAYAVLAKPYDPQTLLAVVSEACNRPIS